MDQRKNKIKILYVLATSTLYGTSRCLLTLIENIDKGQYQPFVIIKGNGPLKETVEKLSIPVKTLNLVRWISKHQNIFLVLLRMPFQLVNILRIMFFIKKYNIDIVHTFDSVCIEGALAAKMTRRPHLWRIGEILRTDPTLFFILGSNIAVKIITSLSYKIIVQSKAINKPFNRAQHKVAFIPSAISPQAYKDPIPDNDIARWKGSSLLIGSLGSISEKKGYIYLMMAADLLNPHYSDLKYLIAGSGDKFYIDRLLSKAEQGGFRNNIKILDFCNNPQNIIKLFDIFVLPSIDEPFGRVVLEAMAAEIPVIGTASGGTPDIIKDGYTGLLCEPRNAVSLKDKIEVLIKDPRLRKQLAKNALNHINNNYSISKHLEAYDTLYKNIPGKN